MSNFTFPATVSLSAGKHMFILGRFPADLDSWTIANPNADFIVLPSQCIKYEVTVVGSTVDAEGYCIEDGKTMGWAGSLTDQDSFSLRLTNTGTNDAALTFTGGSPV